MSCLLSSVTRLSLTDLSLIHSQHRPPTTGGKLYCYDGEINHVARREAGPELRSHSREEVNSSHQHLERKARPSGPQAKDDAKDEEHL